MQWVLAMAFLAAALTASRPASADAAAVSAVWKAQSVRFVYVGRTARYSCDGLREKMRSILIALGARRDLSVIAQRCEYAAQFSSPTSMGPSLMIQFSSLAEANSSGTQPAGGGSVAARYEPFSITTDAFRNLESTDCELVEEFSRQVLPRLATRKVRKDISCAPYAAAGGFEVRGEVLRAVAPR